MSMSTEPTFTYEAQIAAMTPMQRRRLRDQGRTAAQAPIAAPIYRVLYLKDGREHASPRFYSRDHAKAAQRLMQTKYGERNVVLFID